MLLSNYKFINGFNYKCASAEEGRQSLKMRAVCLQTLTSLGAMIGDIGYQNLDQRASSTPSAHVLSEMRQDQTLIATDHKDSCTSACLNKEPVEHILNDLAYVSFICYCSFLFHIIHALL